jgi:GGDEF domain-containing protein
LRQRSKDLVDRVRAEASTAPLTGLSNRRRWQELPLEVERAWRSRAGLAVALLDLDRFKRLNDTAGHGAGDQLLQAVTSVPAPRPYGRLSQARPSLSLPSSRAKSP